MSVLIEIRDLTKVYGGGFEALKGINLSIEQGEILALLGQRWMIRIEFGNVFHHLAAQLDSVRKFATRLMKPAEQIQGLWQL